MISRWLARSQKHVAPPPAPPVSIRELLLRVERQLAGQETPSRQWLFRTPARSVNRGLRRIQTRLHREIQSFLPVIKRDLEILIHDQINRRFNALRGELVELTNDLARRALAKPLIERLILLADRMKKERAFLAAPSDTEPPAADVIGSRCRCNGYDEAVGSFIRELEMLLETLEVRPVKVPAGRFNPTYQQAIGKEPAPRPDLDGMVKKVLRSGYTWHGALLRPEQVIVYEKES